MDIRTITPDYAVSPQIAPTDMAALKAAGFVAVIDNRPDSEIPPELQGDAMEAAARAAGLGFTRLPVTHPTLTPEVARAQAAAARAAGGPVLAYCASGTRSSILWALGQLDTLSVDDVIAMTARAGYDLEGQRPRFEAAQNG